MRAAATSAIAFHADSSADDALERFAAPSQPRELRRKAVFWLGLARGARGFAAVKQAMFWLGQSGDPRALASFEGVLRP